MEQTPSQRPPVASPRPPRQPRRPSLDGRSGGTRVVVWVLLLVVLGLGVWALFGMRQRQAATPAGDGQDNVVDQVPVSVRPVTLFFADHDAVSLQQERREVPFGESLEENVEMTLQAWGRGPKDAGAIPVLPAQVRVMQVFFDEEDRTLYVDFNTALVTAIPGGSAVEFHLLEALLRTVGTNFPEVAAVQILVDGQPIDSLAGHYDTSKPLRVAAWQ